MSARRATTGVPVIANRHTEKQKGTASGGRKKRKMNEMKIRKGKKN
jgi:hypothetical protein